MIQLSIERVYLGKGVLIDSATDVSYQYEIKSRCTRSMSLDKGG